MHNYASRDLALAMGITLDARFEDLFTVRGQAKNTGGVVSEPTFADGELVWHYRGIDELRRSVRIVLPDGASVRPVQDGDERTAAEIELASVVGGVAMLVCAVVVFDAAGSAVLAGTGAAAVGLGLVPLPATSDFGGGWRQAWRELRRPQKGDGNARA